jgi:hypothetical protein
VDVGDVFAESEREGTADQAGAEDGDAVDDGRKA